jgi:hypothetical protein
MSDDVARKRIEELRDRALRERDQHLANLHVATGAVQALEALLVPVEPPVAQEHSEAASS